ncbi:hypothetical protein [Sphingobium mellinum]|uniref:hypothetical protein n=1 Tax=Sphingobium mellinum TaxID=1387166 RepID=UPI0030EE7357
MRKICTLALPALMLTLPCCIARTAVNVATMPVRAGAQVADWATTSQDEADRNYGRKKMRKQEAREARERKKAEEQRRRDCRRAGYDDCG